MTSINLVDAARWYRSMPHQMAAWNQLQEKIPADALTEFAQLYRSAPEAKPAAPTNPLTGVPYFPQLEAGDPEGWRECQTASLAMCLAYLKTPGIASKDDYLAVVQRYGDTTNQQAHRLALEALKVRGSFRQNMSHGDLLAEIKAGLPVAIGVLHHGPVSAPSGGGHYLVIYGFTPDGYYICHDPYGELDLVNGGWAQQGTGGRAVRYSFRNLDPRWLPEGPASGWGWCFS